MKTLRLGIIGTGIAANDLYLPELMRLRSKIELVAVANRRTQKARAFARKAGVPVVCDSADELLARTDVEAVLLSLPIDVVAKWVKKALASGKHVISEKPIAASVAEGQRLIKASRKYPRVWLVGENFYFAPHVLAARRWVEAGRLGEVRLVEASQLVWMARGNRYFETSWRRRPRFVGGFVADGGVHVANVVRELFGMPRVVHSLTGSFNPELPPLDTVVATLAFANGALGVWKSCFSVRAAGERPLVVAYGSKANLEVYYRHATLTPHAPGVKRSEQQTAVSEHSGFYHEFLHFYDCVVRGKPLLFSPRSALLDLELMERLVARARRRPRASL
ncbi:MAG TPA: Gfo/Idh/MocA family oxidoreductase [Polyangiaceae bacterium]